MDFIWGNRAATEIYVPIMDIIKQDQIERLYKQIEELKQSK